jgi:hypothetical protein
MTSARYLLTLFQRLIVFIPSQSSQRITSLDQTRVTSDGSIRVTSGT